MTLRLRTVRWMPCRRLMHRHTRDRELHRARRFDAIRLGMCADDFDAVHHRRALPFKDLRLQALRVRRASVSADEFESRSRTLHHETRHAIAAKRDEACFVEIDDDRFRQPVGAACKPHRSASIHGLLHRRRVICFAIADGLWRSGLSHKADGSSEEEKGENGKTFHG
jgi:hypothetical protein